MFGSRGTSGTIAWSAALALKEKEIALPANVGPVWCARMTLAQPMAGLPISMFVNNHFRAASPAIFGGYDNEIGAGMGVKDWSRQGRVLNGVRAFRTW